MEFVVNTRKNASLFALGFEKRLSIDSQRFVVGPKTNNEANNFS